MEPSNDSPVWIGRHRVHNVLGTLIISAGIALSLGMFFLLRSWEDQSIDRTFQFESENRVSALKKSVEADLWLVKAVAALYAVSPDVDRRHFSEFVKPFLWCHPGVQAIEWVPRVPASQRIAHEQAAQLDGFPDYRIREPNEHGLMTPASPREEYFPVYYLEPLQGNETALGFDLASEPYRLQMLSQARDSGVPLASGRIRLVQGTHGQFSFLVVVPIFRHNVQIDSVELRSENLAGFVMGVFRVGDILGHAISGLHPEGIDMQIYDNSALLDMRFLYSHRSRLRPVDSLLVTNAASQPEDGFLYTATIQVAGRVWQVECTSIPDYRTDRRSWHSWIVLCAGLFSSGLLAIYFVTTIGRTKRVEMLVERRTADLSEANRALEHAYGEMEKRVQERTEELVRTNEELEGEIVERARSEAALIESERDKAAILDSISERLTYLDLELKVLWANRAGSESTGLAPEQMAGRYCYELWLHRSRSCTDCPVVRARDTGRPQRGEMTGHDGRVRIVRGYPVRNEQGEVIALVEVSRDITEEKRTGELLRQSEEKYRMLAENLPAIVYTGYKDWSVEFIDNKIESLTGYGMDEFNSRRMKWSELVVDEDMHSVRDSFRRASVQREHFAREYRIKTRTGDTLWVLDRGQVTPKGEEIHVTGVFFDITDRKKAEKALRESEATLRTILAASPIGICLVQNGSLGWANSAMCRMIGHEEGSLVGENPSILYSSAGEHERVGRTLDYGILQEGAAETDAQLIHRDGRPILCHLCASPLDTLDSAKGVILAVSDITEHRKLEEQLRQAHKMEAIGTLAGGIAHDFNNILGIIMGYTEMSMLDEQDKTLLHANLQQVLSAAGRAKDLVKQILAFSRQSEPKKMPVQVGPLVKEGLKLLRSSLPASIEIRQNIAVNRGSVLADPVQIHQVLMNLCTNAGQAMRGTNGILDVELTENDFTGRVSMPHPDLCPGPYITLSVKDTGHGMTSNTIERIFDPYFTTKKPGEGTGLGLAVVHGIVKACGGAITVASKPGEGSAFQVFFPRVIDAISGGTELPASLPKGTERILVVDDEAILTEIMRKILERLGYEVTARTSSKEALEVFRSEPGRFDAVITDMTMPIMTGNELARELMRVRPDIPIILCTGFSDAISADEARAMGIREYLMKPIVASDLAQSIRRALEPS